MNRGDLVPHRALLWEVAVPGLPLVHGNLKDVSETLVNSDHVLLSLFRNQSPIDGRISVHHESLSQGLRSELIAHNRLLLQEVTGIAPVELCPDHLEAKIDPLVVSLQVVDAILPLLLRSLKPMVVVLVLAQRSVAYLPSRARGHRQ